MDKMRELYDELCEWRDENESRKQRFKISVSICFVAFLVCLSAILYAVLFTFLVKQDEISWKELTNLTVAGNILRLEVIDRKWVYVVMAPGSEIADKTDIRFKIGSPDVFEKKLEDMQKDFNIDPKDYLDIIHKETSQFFLDVFFPIFMVVVVLVVFACMILFPDRRCDDSFADPFKKHLSVAKPINPRDIAVRFSDIGGCEEAKIEIKELVNFLTNPDQYVKLGAKLPKGAILTGPPGTGKTLLAKATAAEANVMFLAVSGTEFVELFIGTGPARVREIFKTSREHSPCILFIDEIDAVGAKRANDSRADSRECNNTLNQLLTEMDGFNTTSNVIVLAATNRIDSLDPALLRKGRFDRQINVPAPDIKGRAKIFECHLRPCKTHLNKKKLSRKMAALTPGLTGADIANICNEAAIVAVRDGSTSIDMKHFEEAIERCIVGIAKTTNVLTTNETKTIAYHEAGHVVAGWFLQSADPLVKVSIVPRGKGLGYSHYSPTDPYLLSKDQLFDTMCTKLGGRVAEEIFFGVITTGAQDDLESVTKSAYAQVVIHGMNAKVGNVSFDVENRQTKPWSEQTGQLIDEEVRLLVDGAYKRTKHLIVEHREDVVKVAESLLKHKVLNRSDIVALLGPRQFVEKYTYEQIVEGAGSLDEESPMPDLEAVPYPEETPMLDEETDSSEEESLLSDLTTTDSDEEESFLSDLTTELSEEDSSMPDLETVLHEAKTPRRNEESDSSEEESLMSDSNTDSSEDDSSMPDLEIVLHEAETPRRNEESDSSEEESLMSDSNTDSSEDDSSMPDLEIASYHKASSIPDLESLSSYNEEYSSYKGDYSSYKKKYLMQYVQTASYHKASSIPDLESLSSYKKECLMSDLQTDSSDEESSMPALETVSYPRASSIPDLESLSSYKKDYLMPYTDSSEEESSMPALDNVSYPRASSIPDLESLSSYKKECLMSDLQTDSSEEESSMPALDTVSYQRASSIPDLESLSSYKKECLMSDQQTDSYDEESSISDLEIVSYDEEFSMPALDNVSYPRASSIPDLESLSSYKKECLMSDLQTDSSEEESSMPALETVSYQRASSIPDLESLSSYKKECLMSDLQTDSSEEESSMPALDTVSYQRASSIPDLESLSSYKKECLMSDQQTDSYDEESSISDLEIVSYDEEFSIPDLETFSEYNEEYLMPDDQTDSFEEVSSIPDLESLKSYKKECLMSGLETDSYDEETSLPDSSLENWLLVD